MTISDVVITVFPKKAESIQLTKDEDYCFNSVMFRGNWGFGASRYTLMPSCKFSLSQTKPYFSHKRQGISVLVGPLTWSKVRIRAVKGVPTDLGLVFLTSPGLGYSLDLFFLCLSSPSHCQFIVVSLYIFIFAMVIYCRKISVYQNLTFDRYFISALHSK